uniref:Calcium uniporter protein C-terminal domain-containing protein n=1 Tax=Nelumbo nucifera TaxID=4432 RepID=A0A822Z0L4_NELNU|nr:TPA_asm: hypothetical protein HUJ06_012834 [Nelumbo nucifera]
MLKFSRNLLQRSLCLSSAVRHGWKPLGLRWVETDTSVPPSPSKQLPKEDDSSTCSGGGGERVRVGRDEISFAEAKKLMRLVNVEALKRKLGMEREEVICYSELVNTCQSMGVTRTPEEAAAFVRVLDEAGVILLFRDKVVDLVRKAVPLALTPDDDPRRNELKLLRKKKEEIDMLAHKQVRRILWSGLGVAVVQVGLFFRLTFWEFSWDVMEPIAFFTTTTGLVIGYAYFLVTSRDPTYQDLMKRLFLTRQRKLFKKHNFNVDRFMELQSQCKSPLDGTIVLKEEEEM